MLIGIILIIIIDQKTLNVQNLNEALKDVPDSEWDHVGRKFRLPESKRQQIRSSCHTDADRKASMIECYIEDHPSPSWENVIHVLYVLEFDKLAEDTAAKYLLGM